MAPITETVSTTGRVPTGQPGQRIVTYEQRLAAEPGWAMNEASRHFEGASAVQETLRKITAKLEELNIAYAVSGAMALFAHGYRRFTEDVDILVKPADLKTIHDKLEGLGYVPPFEKSKNLRDVEHGVKIEFLTTGSFPGDGKPKPVAFPDPQAISVERDGIRYLGLNTLIELKLASSMTHPGRRRDAADVQELIKLFGLPRDFAGQLDPYVRDEYGMLWSDTHLLPTRYVTIWRNKFFTTEAKSIDEMVAILRTASQTLERMKADGVTLDPDGGTSDDYAYLVTTDPEVARKYDMHEESEFLGNGEE
jgi:hypothetical protein